ncbi:MAG: glycosyltransferase family 9 protein [Chitinophagales bacterium]
MKILIIQTAFIGDVVLATALVEKLYVSHTSAEIHFLLRKGNEGLLEGHPLIRKTWIWDKQRSKYRNLLRLLQLIRKEQFDWVVNCQRFASSGFLTAFSGAKNKTGYAKNPFSFLFTRKYSHVIGKRGETEFLHEVERNQHLISSISGGNAANPGLYPSVIDIEKVRVYQGRKYVTICPASVWFTKQLPKVRWAELINKMPSAYTIYLLGATGDKELCDEIIELTTAKNIVNLAGTLSFLQTAALMKDAAMNYTNDSAPLHFASAMKARVTAVFCSTIPQFGFGPLSAESHLLEEKEQLYCRPCGLHGYRTCPEKHFKCAADIKLAAFLNE